MSQHLNKKKFEATRVHLLSPSWNRSRVKLITSPSQNSRYRRICQSNAMPTKKKMYAAKPVSRSLTNPEELKSSHLLPCFYNGLSSAGDWKLASPWRTRTEDRALRVRWVFIQLGRHLIG